MLNLTTRRNAASARKALARLEELELVPLGAYPGSDVHWPMRCGRTGCTWTGHLFYSHLRASRGHDRRHVGCTGAPGTYRAQIPDTDLAKKLTELFPDTDFTITTTDNIQRNIAWTGGPDDTHLAALIGDSQGHLIHHDTPNPST
ncbi:hypothetical protein AB0E96_00580 [Kitasatospora sp. NPDC036755]|uniref:hypothetical protein n=1 Tax=Kitasatospora sp. NPDC036755 TaxID=3154600 RepID=UPI0033F16C0B